MEHARLGVLGGQSFLKCVITFREFAFGAGLPGLRFRDQCRTAGLVLGFGLAAALLKARFDQDVVEHSCDADAECLLDVTGVQNDLEVGPQPLQIIGVHLRGGLVFVQVMLVTGADDSVHATGQHEAPR